MSLIFLDSLSLLYFFVVFFFFICIVTFVFNLKDFSSWDFADFLYTLAEFYKEISDIGNRACNILILGIFESSKSLDDTTFDLASVKNVLTNALNAG